MRLPQGVEFLILIVLVGIAVLAVVLVRRRQANVQSRPDPSSGQPDKAVDQGSSGGVGRSLLKGAQGLLIVVVLVVVGIVVFGFQRAQTDEFKVRCAAYQTLHEQMSFPDNLICVAYWQVQ